VNAMLTANPRGTHPSLLRFVILSPLRRSPLCESHLEVLNGGTL
jgi:hypothetical protein